MANVILCKLEPLCGYGQDPVVEQRLLPIRTGKGVG